MRNFQMRIRTPRIGKANLSKRCGANMEGDQGSTPSDAAEKLQAEGFTAGG
jgi:hypothetical protein